MIKEFVKAWDENNKLLLEEFEHASPTSYQDIVEKLVKIVINPYLQSQSELEYPLNEGLDIESMTVIDNGDYQGTTIYVIPFNVYQPGTKDYVFTDNYYGSCSGCDTFLAIESALEWDENGKCIPTKESAEDFHTLALHLLQNFKWLESAGEADKYLDTIRDAIDAWDNYWGKDVPSELRSHLFCAGKRDICADINKVLSSISISSKTNFEKIKSLSFTDFVNLADNTYDECLIRIFSGKEHECSAMKGREEDKTCKECWERWLLSTYDE